MSVVAWPKKPAVWILVSVVVGGLRSTVFSSLNGCGAIRVFPTTNSCWELRTLRLFPKVKVPARPGLTRYDAVAARLWSIW